VNPRVRWISSFYSVHQIFAVLPVIFSNRSANRSEKKSLFQTAKISARADTAADKTDNGNG